MTVPADRGHALRPHTADVRIEAWAPTEDACFEEVVAAVVAVFADVAGAPPGRTRPLRVGPGSPERLVVLLVDEVLASVDAEGLVPRAARLARRGDELAGELDLVPLDAVEATGSGVKGVSYQGLSFGPDGDGWRCRATVDV